MFHIDRTRLGKLHRSHSPPGRYAREANGGSAAVAGIVADRVPVSMAKVVLLVPSEYMSVSEVVRATGAKVCSVGLIRVSGGNVTVAVIVKLIPTTLTGAVITNKPFC